MRERTLTPIKYAALVALGVQGIHFIEHIAQFGYWFAHPTEAPWMTPWAHEAMGWLAIGGNIKLGMESLHLIGNLIFLGGVMALLVWFRSQDTEGVDLVNIRRARTIQTWHVLEHIALTSTVIMFGKGIGVSTLFGLVDGPVLFSTRVWFHFLINLVATWYAARSLGDNAQLLAGQGRRFPRLNHSTSPS